MIMKPISDSYELVSVHKSTKGKVEVTIRNKNKYEAFGGILKEYSNPKSVYPTDLTLKMAQKEKGAKWTLKDF